MSSEVRAWTETDNFYQKRSALSFYVYKLYGDSKKRKSGFGNKLTLKETYFLKG